MEAYPIYKLRPGHVVAEAVKNAKGVVLFPAGHVLTAQIIGQLRGLGIRSVLVRNSDPSASAGDDRIAALEDRFKGIANPDLLHIRDLARKRLTKHKLERNLG